MKLPEPHEPLVLADGTVINPMTGRPEIKFVEVPAPSKLQETFVSAKRKLEDLPAPPHQMHPISLVAFYSLMGLSDEEIAIGTERLTVEQVRRIKSLDAYTKAMEMVIEGVREADRTTVQGLINTEAANSIRRIIEVRDSGDDMVALKASQDILDRAGYRPVDTTAAMSRMDTLNIVITAKKDNPDPPTIEVDYESI